MRYRQALVDILRAKGIEHPLVLKALMTVPREKFIPESQRPYAYDDNALAIEEGQTISQPYIVAIMTEWLLTGTRTVTKVLEVGTGSGYQAAVLAECVSQVFTVERIEHLYQQARARLQAQYPDKVAQGQLQIHYGDGTLGWPEQAPFDGIIVTAATSTMPKTLLTQLAEGGRCVSPVGEQELQYLSIVTRRGDHFDVQRSQPVRFVPLCSGLKPKNMG